MCLSGTPADGVAGLGAVDLFLPLQDLGGDLFPAHVRRIGGRDLHGHVLGEGRAQGVVAALGEDIRAGCDEVDVHLIRGAGVFQPCEAHVGFVNLALLAEGEDLFFHPRIQGVQGTEVEVLQVQSHGR